VIAPIPCGGKSPIGHVDNVFTDCSSDRAKMLQWSTSLTPCNWVIVAGRSRWIIVDIDVKELERDRAWALWCQWCADNGIDPNECVPQVSTPSQGWHIYFALPDDVDAMSLRSPQLVRPTEGAKKAIVETKAGRGYVVAPGSFYDGSNGGPAGHYQFINKNAPYPAPAGLLRACMTNDSDRLGVTKPGGYDREQVAALLRWLTDEGAFKDRGEWVKVGMALAVEYGDDGLELWRLTHDATVTARVESRQWRSFDTEAKAGQVTIASFLKRAHDMGWRGSVQRTAASMFEGVALPNAESPPTVPSTDASAQKLILSDAEFVANFVAPHYVVDGIIQRGYFYCFTAAPGGGKTAIALSVAAHVGLGRKLGDREVEQGAVLYFAAENVQDVQARWIAAAQHYGFEIGKTNVHFVSGNTKLSEIADRITQEAASGPDLALVVVDTSAATFEGQDDNSNVEQMDHAKRMRDLTGLRGNPAVLLLTHPVKSATTDNLVPRGGGALIGEADGNLCARKKDGIAELHWHFKFRGPDFPPIPFELRTVTAEGLRDRKGRKMPTVVAFTVDEAKRKEMAVAGRRDQDIVLRAVWDNRDKEVSLADIATALGWTYGKDNKPNKMRVQRAIKSLDAEKLIYEYRGVWRLTPKGEKELNEQDRKRGVTTPVTALTPITPRVNA
jgi:hypothetical protein